MRTELNNHWKLLVPALVFLLSQPSPGISSASSFEIVSHRARIHLFPREGLLRVSDTLRLRSVSGDGGTLHLGLSPQYAVQKVTTEGTEIPFQRTREGISVDASKFKREMEITVEFSGKTAVNPELSRMTPERAILHDSEFLVRGGKVLESLELTIVVPQDWQAIGRGVLQTTRKVGDSTEFVWVAKYPIPGVGWICAGPYRVASSFSDSIQFSLYLFQEDSSDAQRLLTLAKNVTEFYSKQFASYRFGSLTIVEVDDWLGGPAVLAAAIPSTILVKQVTLNTEDDFNKIDWILPHEIAHQWWPQTVYIREEDVAFLSEGTCEYATRLYEESAGRPNPRTDLKSHPLLHSLIMRAKHGKEVPLNRRADLRALRTHYLKAAYTHHMLRQVVGDSALETIYREFTARYSLKNAGMKEFQSIAEEVSHKSLGWFFDQWIMGTGLPRFRLYNVKAERREKGWLIRGRVRTVGYHSYTSPIVIAAYGRGGSEKTVLWIGRDSTKTVRNDLPFEIPIQSKPERVLLDPEGDVLKLQRMPVRLSDLREPASGLMIVGTKRLADRLLQFARRDSAELEQSGWSIRIKMDTITTLADYRSERVFLYGTPSMNAAITQLGRRFPVNCDDQKCLWNGKVYADTSLALTQIIENPFQEGSLLCWLVPLGDNAQPILRPLSASAVVARRGEVLESWTWDTKDEELEVELETTTEE